MEENEIMSLKNSKMYVARVGRWMNIFSVFATLAMLFIVAGGIVMLYVSNWLDEATPYYLDNVIGLGGVGMIVLAGALIPAILYMRRAVREANQIKVSQEVYPVVEFLRQSQKLWHYTTVLLIVLFILGVIAVGVAGLYYFSVRSAM
jgi:hypothetical protein